MSLFQKKKSGNSSVPAEKDNETDIREIREEKGGEKKKKKSIFSIIFNHTILSVNIIAIVFLFCADSATTISPDSFILPSYFGLAFPLIALVVLAFLIFWIVRLKWYFIISLISLLFCYNSIAETFPFHSSKKAPETSIKIMSYNVHLFEFYTEKSRNNVLKYLTQSDADIICLQEFGYSTNATKKFLKEKEIMNSLKKKFPYHHINIKFLEGSRTFGVATFSKFPINKRKSIKYNSQYNSSIITEVIIWGKPIKIYNCHLESNKLTENDKTLIKKLKNNFDNNKVNEVASHLSKKLGPSYRLRAKQAELIAADIKKSNTPVLLCGDFNDVPISYAYNTIKGDYLTDAFTECGYGYGYTFNENLFRFRIDHIMHSKEFEAFEFNIDYKTYSDHYPITCRMILK